MKITNIMQLVAKNISIIIEVIIFKSEHIEEDIVVHKNNRGPKSMKQLAARSALEATIKAPCANFFSLTRSCLMLLWPR